MELLLWLLSLLLLSSLLLGVLLLFLLLANGDGGSGGNINSDGVEGGVDGEVKMLRGVAFLFV